MAEPVVGSRSEAQGRGLRFLMVTTFYPPFNFGGDGIGIQRLSRALVRRGHEVTVVHDEDAYDALAPGASPEPVPDDEGVRVVGLRSPFGSLSPLLVQQTGRPMLHRRRLRSLLGDGGFDVVNFHNVSLVGGPGVLSMAPDAITLYMAHEHWLVCPMHVLWRYGKERCDGRDCLRCTLAHHRPPAVWRSTGYLDDQLDHVDAVIAMSEFSRRKHREFGLQRDMEVLPYFLPDPAPGDRGPVPPSEAASSSDRPSFLVVGRLERIKGIDDAIAAMRSLPEADLLIAGEGDDGDRLRELASDLPNVVFLGRLGPDDLRARYAEAVALVVPSVCFETFGIVLIEAFREGTPVIARDLGPLPEIVDASGGGDVFETVDDLVGVMRRHLADPAGRATRSAAAYRGYLERWSESAVVPRYLDLVRRIAATKGRTSIVDRLPMEQNT